MITWEMIKELTENPEKEFISYELGDGRDVLKTKSICGVIRFFNEEDRWHEVLIGVDLEREWEEVKEPVDFMTAITSGKKVSVKCAIETYEGKGKLREIYYRQPNEMLRALAGYGDEAAIDIILNGKWYIED